jgi:hypothetical protein
LDAKLKSAIFQPISLQSPSNHFQNAWTPVQPFLGLVGREHFGLIRVADLHVVKEPLAKLIEPDPPVISHPPGVVVLRPVFTD